MSDESGVPDFLSLLSGFSEAERKAAELNKPILHKALDTADVARLTIRYDGCGDSGSVESVEATNSRDEVVDITKPTVEVWDTNRSPPKKKTCSLEQACTDFAYDLLTTHHPGWEINDGSFGEFVWQVRVSDLKLTHNERYTEIRTDETTID